MQITAYEAFPVVIFLQLNVLFLLIDWPMNKTPANHSATVAIAACIHEGEKLQKVVLYALGDFKFIIYFLISALTLSHYLPSRAVFDKEKFMVSNSVTLHSVSAKILHTDQVKMVHNKSYFHLVYNIHIIYMKHRTTSSIKNQ